MNEERESPAELLGNGKSFISLGMRGRSMEPLLHEGKSFVIIRPLSGKLKIGDLPLRLRYNGRYVLHRLVDEDEMYYYTRGDNCVKKERFLKKRIIGVVTEINRNGTWFPVTDRRYRAYVWLWMHSFPLRFLWYGLRNIAGRGLREVKEWESDEHEPS